MSLSKQELFSQRPARVKAIEVEVLGTVYVRTLSPRELLWYEDEASKLKKENRTDELIVTNLVAFWGDENGARFLTHDEARKLLDDATIPSFVITRMVEEGADFNGMTELSQDRIRGKS